MASKPGIDTGATVAALDAMLARVKAAAPKIALTGAILGQKYARIHASTGRPGLQVRTGRLRASIRAHAPIEVRPGVWESRTYPTVIYARVQELGADIYAKPRIVFWRDRWGNLHKSRGMMHWVGDPAYGDRPGPQYAFHVHIPARPYLDPGRRDTIAPFGVVSKQMMEAAIGG